MILLTTNHSAEVKCINLQVNDIRNNSAGAVESDEYVGITKEAGKIILCCGNLYRKILSGVSVYVCDMLSMLYGFVDQRP